MKDFIVSASSIPSRWADVDFNLQHVLRAAERAANRNARLLLLPECILTGADWPTGVRTPPVSKVALRMSDPAVKEIGRMAKKTGLVVAVGLYEKTGRGIRISQALVGPKGMMGVFRKVHAGSLSSTDRNLFPVFDLGFARVGVCICYDNMFPEHARILTLKGAEVLLCPFTSLPFSREAWEDQRLVVLRARAYDNRAFVVSTSHAGPQVKGKPSEWGNSGICCAVDPLGRVLKISKGKAGKPQSVTVRLKKKTMRTYYLADNPAIRIRRFGDYSSLASGKLQKAYLRSAAKHVMHQKSNLMIA